MNLKIKLFGVLSEIANTDELMISSVESIEAQAIIDYAIERYPEMKLVQLKLAVNQKIVTEGSCDEHDEIALLPPFAGG
ncbi:MAG: MoaD/ThiS family protein [Cyclobacteriaceae bacterium]